MSSDRVFFWLGALLLVVSFSVNLLGLGLSHQWFTQFQQKDSAEIVRKTVECKGVAAYSGPLTWRGASEYEAFTETSDCSESVVRPYESQYGLQIRAATFFAPENTKHYFTIIEMALSVLLAAVLMALVHKLRLMFGFRAAVAVFVMILFSPWIAAYARNMYWSTYLMFLPFVFSFVAYEWFKAKRLLRYFYMSIFALLYLKLLNGYEHISTLMVSALVPVVFYELRERRYPLKNIFRPAVAIFISGTFALGLAILTNITSLVGYYGSWSKSAELVFARAEDRASNLKAVQPNVIWGLEVTLPEIYHYIDARYDLDVYKSGEAHPIKYAAISVLNYALLPAVSIPLVISEPLGTIVESVLFVGVLSYLAVVAVSKNRVYRRYARSLKYSYWLSLAGAVSWLVLMPGHAYPHAHLNAIVFYMPFLLICYMAIGLWVASRIKRVK